MAVQPDPVTCVVSFGAASAIRPLAKGVQIVTVGEDGSVSVAPMASDFLTPDLYKYAIRKNNTQLIEMCVAKGIALDTSWVLSDTEVGDVELCCRYIKAGGELSDPHIKAMFVSPGAMDVLRALLDAKPRTPEEKSRFVVFAIRAKTIEIMEYLLKNGADPNVPYKRVACGTADPLLPLHVACAEGDVPMVELLLAHGADINASYERECTNGALYFAALNGKTEIVDLLLKKGVDVHSGDEYGKDIALRIAADGGNIKMARLLLDHGADIHVETKFAKERPLYNAVIRTPSLEMTKFLVERGANVLPFIVNQARDEIKEYLKPIAARQNIAMIMEAAKRGDEMTILEMIS